MRFVGVDNGSDGGIAVLDDSGRVDACLPMPVVDIGKTRTRRVVDLPTVRALLEPLGRDVRVVVELAQPYPGEGAVQSFQYGRGFGAILGLLVGLGLPHEVVDPKVWQRAVLAGTEGGDTKVRALLRAQREWPRQVWTATPRARVAHPGMVDAACIALYARRSHLGLRDVAPLVDSSAAEALLGGAT